jgi:hypothetical protein
MPDERFQEMSVLAVRISRLDDDGTPSFGDAEGSLVLCDGISSFEPTHELQEGEEFAELDAGGKLCVSFKRPNAVKWTSFNLTVCSWSLTLEEILGVASPVEDAGEIVGTIVNVQAGCAGASDPNAVAIELWSERIDCTERNTTFPYLRTVLPKALLSPQGWTKENGVSKPVYSGFSLANSNFGDGPWGDLDAVELETNWCYGHFLDDALPTCPDPFDYSAMPAGAS